MATKETLISSIFCLFLTISQFLGFVRTESPSIVGLVCERTPEPGYCQHCIDSYPRNPTQTVKDLAGTAIQCVKNESIAVQNILNRYKPKGIKEIGQCLVIFGVGMKNTLSSVQDSFVKRQYENTGLYLDSAKSVYLECYNLLRKARFVAPDLETALYWFRAYDDVAKSVVGLIV